MQSLRPLRQDKMLPRRQAPLLADYTRRVKYMASAIWMFKHTAVSANFAFRR